MKDPATSHDVANDPTVIDAFNKSVGANKNTLETGVAPGRLQIEVPKGSNPFPDNPLLGTPEDVYAEEDDDELDDDEVEEQDADAESDAGDEDEQDDDASGLTADERRAHVRALRNAGVSPNKIAGLDDEALSRMAEAFADEDGDFSDSDEDEDDAGEGKATKTPSTMTAAFEGLREKLGDEEGEAIEALFKPLFGAVSAIAKQNKDVMKVVENMSLERVRASATDAFPALADSKVWNRVRSQMVKQAKTGDFSPNDLSALLERAVEIEKIQPGKGDKKAQRTRKRDAQLRRTGQPTQQKRRSGNGRASTVDPAEKHIQDAFVGSVRRNFPARV